MSDHQRHSPHSPHSLAQESRATDPHSLAPPRLYKAGGRVGGCSPLALLEGREKNRASENRPKTFADLERQAVDAHRAGVPWAIFWSDVADAVRALAPWDRRKYQRLVAHLLALLVSGDTDGMEPPGSAPWEQDDQ